MSHEMEMFGTTQANLDEALASMVIPDARQMAMSILSDAQEELVRGNAGIARQLMNRAKYFISTGTENRS